MRYQGKILSWNSERGFGFVVINGGTEKTFVHISSFSSKKRMPEIGDIVTYELGPADAKGQKAIKVQFADSRPIPQTRRRKKTDKSSIGIGAIFPVLLIAGGLYWWLVIRQPAPETVSRNGQSHNLIQSARPLPVASKFSCEGKTRCPQMTSCEEATYYVQHCPNTDMDGDNDGVPCESQWCQ